MSRKPLAPARIAACTYSSRSNVVSTRIRAGEPPGDEAPGRLDAVQHRHPDVHQDHVRRTSLGQRDGLGPVLGLADHLDVGLGLEDRPEPRADQRLVVADEDPDAHAPCLLERDAGSNLVAAVRSRPGAELPPNSATRSRIPISPCPAPSPLTGGRAASVVEHLELAARRRRSAG